MGVFARKFFFGVLLVPVIFVSLGAHFALASFGDLERLASRPTFSCESCAREMISSCEPKNSISSDISEVALSLRALRHSF